MGFIVNIKSKIESRKNMENRIWQGKEWERSQSGGQKVQTTGLEVTSANKEKPGILHWDNRKGVLRKIITHQEFQIL